MIYILIIITNALVVGGLFFTMFKFFNNRISAQQLELLSVIVNAKDQYIVSHEEHAAVLSSLLYDHLPKETKKKVNKKRLIKAARLHDIGKIYISDEIINKVGKLTDEEYEKMKTHANIGAQILDRTLHNDVSVFVNWHHERPDGLGYYKAVDEQIPIESKIIAIADTFSALTTSRCYRPVPKSIPEALDILKEVAGTQLDAELVRYFLEIEVKKLVAVDTMLKGQYYR